MRMKQLSAAVVMGMVFSGAAATVARAADSFKIDPIHGTVIYRINHLGVANAYGRFDEPTGTVTIDKDDASKSSFNFEVQTTKVDTGNPKRDQHLQSPDFFNAKQFPTITFKSTSVKSSGDNKYEVAGDLTLHGVTKPITVTMEKTGEAQTQMGYRSGWQTEVDLKRSDYGMKGLQGVVGDDVHLIISFEAVKQ
jgi:polyisoprenoid-binding protein YceI